MSKAQSLMAAIFMAVILALTATVAAAQTTDTEAVSPGGTVSDPEGPGTTTRHTDLTIERAAEDPVTDDSVYLPGDGDLTATNHSSSLRSCTAGFTITHDESHIMELINDKRASQGNQRMCVDRRLMHSAQDWSNYMAKTHSFFHGGLRYICDRYDYCRYDVAKENIGYRSDRTPAPGVLFNAYLNSNEGHREAMLGSNRDRMGTAWRGNDKGDSGYSFNTLHFTNHPGE